MSITDGRIAVLARAMDATALRHQITATNIANINTPQYRAQELDFESTFRDALRRGDLKEAVNVSAKVVEREGAKVKADGNSVHLEHEFGVLQKNAMMFDIYSSILRGKLQMMKRAISGQG
ncbi:MAG: flagellar basal body rod protein FlgB [Planctomycetota bacterium]